MTLKDKRTKTQLAAEEKERRTENLLALGLVILVLVAISWFAYSRFTAPPPDDVRVPVPVGNSPEMGSGVLVVEFSDFECPYCSTFALEHFPEIKERYIDTGQVRFVYKHFPLTQIHQYALPASLAAACAHDQGQFWEYHDILYANQDALQVNQLLGYGEELDLDSDRFRSCVINEEMKEAVAVDKEIGFQAGIKGTPTFLFNGRRITGALTPDEFGAELEKEHANRD